ncbi:hypothetical protein QT381_08535 [Galbitalea sp. SE-J8]|uniref:hypothetical protein n=1 Tax=Galbitalea sp. SE-J8 TaxID=3054952 RepID=UPI00259D075E|nr:hypothetical protein [Galbitalea sp. SE-J8]MDM4763053.1 hypothetical protein [Galbitalea sp. SE-J8]
MDDQKPDTSDSSPLSVAIDDVAASDDETIEFTTVITNDSDAPVVWDVCPDYSITLSSRASEAKHEYQLNCGKNGGIAAGGSDRFDMKVVGDWDSSSRLLWQLDDGPTASVQLADVQ